MAQEKDKGINQGCLSSLLGMLKNWFNNILTNYIKSSDFEITNLDEEFGIRVSNALFVKDGDNILSKLNVGNGLKVDYSPDGREGPSLGISMQDIVNNVDPVNNPTSLMKFTVDSWGRVSSYEKISTEDLKESLNLQNQGLILNGLNIHEGYLDNMGQPNYVGVGKDAYYTDLIPVKNTDYIKGYWPILNTGMWNVGMALYNNKGEVLKTMTTSTTMRVDGLVSTLVDGLDDTPTHMRFTFNPRYDNGGKLSMFYLSINDNYIFTLNGIGYLNQKITYNTTEITNVKQSISSMKNVTDNVYIDTEGSTDRQIIQQSVDAQDLFTPIYDKFMVKIVKVHDRFTSPIGDVMYDVTFAILYTDPDFTGSIQVKSFIGTNPPSLSCFLIRKAGLSFFGTEINENLYENDVFLFRCIVPKNIVRGPIYTLSLLI